MRGDNFLRSRVLCKRTSLLFSPAFLCGVGMWRLACVASALAESSCPSPLPVRWSALLILAFFVGLSDGASSSAAAGALGTASPSFVGPARSVCRSVDMFDPSAPPPVLILVCTVLLRSDGFASPRMRLLPLEAGPATCRRAVRDPDASSSGGCCFRMNSIFLCTQPPTVDCCRLCDMVFHY